MFFRKVMGRAAAATATTGLLVAPLALTTAPAFTNVACTDDTVVELSLDETEAQYGTRNFATVKITPKPTRAETVVFSLDGPSRAQTISRSTGDRGEAQWLLPRGLTAGNTYTVTADYDGCAATTDATYTVNKATAKPVPSVINGRKAKFRTTVIGGGGLDPNRGQVPFLVRRAGGDVMREMTNAYLKDGVATVNLKNLKKGRYVLVVNYVGNANFLPGKGKKAFRVR